MLFLETNEYVAKDSAAPVHVVSAFDKAMAPFMKHAAYLSFPEYVLATNPQTFPVKMFDGRSGIVIESASADGPILTPAHPDFGGKPTFTFTGTGGLPLKLKKSRLLTDYTFVTVTRRPAISSVMTAGGLLPGNVFGDMFRTLGNDAQIAYGAASNVTLESNIVSTVGLVARTVPAIYMASYEEATKTSRQFVNTTMVKEFVHPTSKTAGPDRSAAEYALGGTPNNLLPWGEPMGRAMYFDVPLGADRFAQMRGNLMMLLRDYYSLNW